MVFQNLRRLVAAICLFAGVTLAAASGAAPRVIEVAALFEGAAVLEVDGASRLVKVGGSFAGVALVAANSREAVVQIDGEQRTLALSDRIASTFSKAKAVSVSMTLSQAGQYATQGTINGHPAAFVVDTGANIVALNEIDARAMAINYTAGEALRVQTAGGAVRGWRVKLGEVTVGAITVMNVEAAVLEGQAPPKVLLGMSFLRHVEISEKNGVMVLSSEFQ